MFYFLVRKLFRTFIIATTTATICFIIITFLPGDPAELTLKEASEAISQDKIYEIRQLMGLEKPAFSRALRWIKDVFSFNFGRSYRSGEWVIKEISSRLPHTVTLAFITVIWVVPCSIVGAWFSLKSIWCRKLFSVIGLVGFSIPDYILSIGLIFLFSVFLKLHVESVPFLPFIALGLPMFSFYFNVTLTFMTQIMNSDFIRFAYAKGLSERSILLGHLLPCVFVLLLVPWAMSLGRLMTGAVIVETIFGLPGVGKFFIDALLSRDYPVIQAIVLWSGWIIGLFVSIADLIVSYINPRVETSGM